MTADEARHDIAPSAPLAGITVIELTQWLQGSIAARCLGELGAQVVKIERPSGDPSRFWRVSYGIKTSVGSSGSSFTYSIANHGKANATLDLHSEDDLAVLRDLIAKSEVFITNLRESALQKLGLTFLEVARINPSIVYGWATGLGTRGPDRDAPVQDAIGMGASGFMYTLSPDGHTPQYVPGSLSDIIAGSYLAMGVSAALAAHNGPHLVECSQLQALLWTQMMNVGAQATVGQTYPPIDRRRRYNPMFNHYEARDGKWLIAAVIQETQWPEFCSVLDRLDLMVDARFVDTESRARNSESLIETLDDTFKTRDRSDWLDAFARMNLWAGPIYTISEAIESAQTSANGYLYSDDDGVAAPRSAVTITRSSEAGPSRNPTRRNRAPKLGEDNGEIRAMASYVPPGERQRRAEPS